MNPEIKAEWLAALRSGDYKQGRGTLHAKAEGPGVSDSFCCLGVLCDVAVSHGIVDREEAEFEYLYDGASWALPDKVAEWSGVSDWGYLAEDVYEQKFLTDLNDAGFPFPEIADIIEEHL